MHDRFVFLSIARGCQKETHTILSVTRNDKALLTHIDPQHTLFSFVGTCSFRDITEARWWVTATYETESLIVTIFHLLMLSRLFLLLSPPVSVRHQAESSCAECAQGPGPGWPRAEAEAAEEALAQTQGLPQPHALSPALLLLHHHHRCNIQTQAQAGQLTHGRSP